MAAPLISAYEDTSFCRSVHHLHRKSTERSHRKHDASTVANGLTFDKILLHPRSVEQLQFLDYMEKVKKVRSPPTSYQI